MNDIMRIPVLMYHRVGASQNEWEARYAISSDQFMNHMHALANKGYRAISIDTFIDWLNGGPPPPEQSLVITFDDGFRGVYEHALPVLEKLGWPFTVFLVSDLIGGQDVWTQSENPSGATYPLLNDEEILDMKKRGVSFHSNPRSHASLPTLDDGQLTDQLSVSRKSLSQLLEQEVEYIAYPFGHVDERVEAATRSAGYLAAFSTQPGFNRRDVNHFRIRRIDVFGTDTAHMLLRKIKLGTNDGSFSHAARYYLDRIVSRLPGMK